MTSTPPFPWPRALIFVGLTALMAAGPVHNQVLGQRYSYYLKPWRMYFSFGTQLCEVRYVQVAPNGDTRTLDRYALLGYDDWRAAPEAIRNLPDGPTIGNVGHRLCEVLPARRPDVRAEARCANIHGWRPALDPQQNLCALGPRQIQGLLPPQRPGRP